MNLTSGLVGYWSLDGDDISGTTAYDRSGSGNNGTLTNGPTKTAGCIGQALSFDGGDDYVTISSSSALSIGTAATYSTWVKMNALPPSSYGYSLIRKWSNGSEDKTLAIAQNGKPNLFFYNVGSGVNANTVLSTGVWHHIVGTYDGTTEKIYIDGVLDNSNSASGDVADNVGAAVTLGHTPENSAYLNGFLDDVRIYNRSLSATEVRALYDVGNPDKVNTAQGDSLEQGLAGYWKLDDASGTTATDSSGNANNGTLTNGPTWGTGQVKGDTVFDGVNDYVTTPNSTAIDMGANQDFTLALWVKASQAATAGQHPMMLSKEDVNNPRQGYNMFLHAQTDDPTWYLELFSNGTAAYAVGKSNIADGQWHHIVGMRKGGTLYSYEDGGLATVNAAGFTGSLSKNIPLRFGRSSGSGWYFNGSLDEVRIYNRALSSEEVGKLYRETAPDNPDTGLVGYWPFNGKDISGTTAYDRSGKGMNGTLTNGPTRTAGRIGQALNFDGTDDRVNVGDVKTTGNFTYAAWVKVDPAMSQTFYIFDKEIGGTLWPSVIMAIDFATKKASVSFCRADYDIPTVNANQAIQLGIWTHIVGTYDGTNLRIYLNGTLDNTTITSGTPRDINNNLTIGARQYDTTPFYNNFAKGSIDEARVYNRALSATEIATLYKYGK